MNAVADAVALKGSVIGTLVGIGGAAGAAVASRVRQRGADSAGSSKRAFAHSLLVGDGTTGALQAWETTKAAFPEKMTGAGQSKKSANDDTYVGRRRPGPSMDPGERPRMTRDDSDLGRRGASPVPMPSASLQSAVQDPHASAPAVRDDADLDAAQPAPDAGETGKAKKASLSTAAPDLGRARPAMASGGGTDPVQSAQDAPDAEEPRRTAAPSSAGAVETAMKAASEATGA